METIAPHERALLLLDDGRSVAGEECRKAGLGLSPPESLGFRV